MTLNMYLRIGSRHYSYPLYPHDSVITLLLEVDSILKHTLVSLSKNPNIVCRQCFIHAFIIFRKYLSIYESMHSSICNEFSNL